MKKIKTTWVGEKNCRIPLRRPKDARFQLWLRLDLFNPFRKRPIGEIIPIFHFTPRIGVGIDRTSKRITLHLGWLNFALDFWFYWFGIQTNLSRVRVPKRD